MRKFLMNLVFHVRLKMYDILCASIIANFCVDFMSPTIQETSLHAYLKLEIQQGKYKDIYIEYSCFEKFRKNSSSFLDGLGFLCLFQRTYRQKNMSHHFLLYTS